MKFNNPNRLLLISAIVLCCSSVGLGQAPTKTGSIAGRVTVGGKGLADVVVVAMITVSYQERATARATTDEDGNYRITGLPVGSFRILPIAKSYSISSVKTFRNLPGQSIQVAEGEAVTNVDFQLFRGGVITGRITDTEGNSVIGEEVHVTSKEAGAREHFMGAFGSLRNRTDDRGIYRIYGLGSGHYKVSVGHAVVGAVGTMRFGNQYLRTFYPGVAEESKATTVEVKEGGEVSNIDFTVGRPPTGFAVSGRVIDATTGEPVPNISLGYSSIDPEHQQMAGMDFSPTPTDANGKFRLEGFQPGNYGIFSISASPIGTANKSYSDLARFEITDADVTGIEVKLRRGATIKGIAVIENSEDPSVLALLSTVQLYTYVETDGPGPGPPSFGHTKILLDGSFSFSGLGPGKTRIAVQEYPAPPKGMHLARVELNGISQETIEVAAGADITGVRLVFNHGFGSLRGRVKVEGGTLPEGVTIWVGLLQPGDSPRRPRYVEVDARGQFFVDNLLPGTYEINARALVDRRNIPGIPAITRQVTIVNNVETEINLVFNLAAGKP